MKAFGLVMMIAANLAVAQEPRTSYWNGSTWNDPDRGFLWYAPPRPAAPTLTAAPGRRGKRRGRGLLDSVQGVWGIPLGPPARRI